MSPTHRKFKFTLIIYCTNVGADAPVRPWISTPMLFVVCRERRPRRSVDFKPALCDINDVGAVVRHGRAMHAPTKQSINATSDFAGDRGRSPLRLYQYPN